MIHSKILNEDRAVLVRMPAAAQGRKDRYAVVYLTDGGNNVNEIGSTIDFLVNANLMPPLIVVGITNTRRARDLTPTNARIKRGDGTIDPVPSSGGADRFLEFIEKELAPEIDHRYPTHPYRILVGHSLGGMFAVHAMTARPHLFDAYIVSSSSLWWDDFRVLAQTQEFLAHQKEFGKTIFFAIGDEGGPLGESHWRLQKIVAANRPQAFVAESAHYIKETHRSTELLTHYDGLRLIFAGWQVPEDEQTELPAGGLAGIERHYRALSERFRYQISAERAINSFGYEMLRAKKLDDALTAFQRNVELYPGSANVHDSLADALEAKGNADSALESVRKAVDLATQSGDPELPGFQEHLERLTAAAKVEAGKK